MGRENLMINKKPTKFEEFKEELLKDPAVRQEYEALQPKYTMIASIIERRNTLKLSQVQLARIIGTQQPAISRLEKGNCDTKLGTLFKVVNALGMDVSVTVREDDNTFSDKIHV